MTCDTVVLPGGARAIVCGPRKRQRCGCGRTATRLCDWKTGKEATCDLPLCRGCTTTPAPEKDLCEAHAAAHRRWKAQRAAR